MKALDAGTARTVAAVLESLDSLYEEFDVEVRGYLDFENDSLYLGYGHVALDGHHFVAEEEE